MAGRKPKPTAVKKLEGNPGKRKLNSKEPVPAKGIPACPDWLMPEAKKEWERLAELMNQMGVLTEVDMAAFAAYCQSYARWKEAQEHITSGGSTFETAQIIKNGGYATSLTYVDKLCSIIKRWKLTQYDVAGEASDVVKYYRVRKSWDDAKSQLGAYTIFANAKAMADKHPGYEVYDWDGKQVYLEMAEGAAGGMTNVDCPFLVKVSIPDLNIRSVIVIIIVT